MITVTDLFCGAGGSGLGATAVPGVALVMAANHWPLAVETHAANFPGTDHDCADISQVDPRRYRPTDLLWASPECTWQSGARGRRRDDHPQPGLFGDRPPADAGAGVRSRATMFDVHRFAECHRYAGIVVENVVEAFTHWELRRAWFTGLADLGYAWRVVSLNSMHAPALTTPRAPQSRDRAYCVAWRTGHRTPDLEIRPPAWCARCAAPVAGVQWWKRPAPRPAGKYQAQYLYRCPACHEVVTPGALPAASVIDWSLPAQRIADRAIPLKPATLARIQAGLDRYAIPPLVPATGTANDQAPTVTGPLRETGGLLVPVEGRQGKHATPAELPVRTQTTRAETALVVPYYGTGRAHPATQPLHTVATRDRSGLAGWPAQPPPIGDCTFRMLAVPEISAAMAFTPGYVIKGTKREQVRQLGNAVTPPAAEWLTHALVTTLGGAR